MVPTPPLVPKSVWVLALVLAICVFEVADDDAISVVRIGLETGGAGQAEEKGRGCCGCDGLSHWQVVASSSRPCSIDGDDSVCWWFSDASFLLFEDQTV